MAASDTEDYAELVAAWRANVPIQDRRYRLTTYRRCFVGEEAVAWLVSEGLADDVDAAVTLGNRLLDQGLFHHVVRDHRFKNAHLFYRWAVDDHRGRVDGDEDEEAARRWIDLVLADAAEVQHAVQASLTRNDRPGDDDCVTVGHHDVAPLDAHNAALLDHVHPRNWQDPTPTGTYNMVVIGGGTAGLVTAAATAGLGGRVALIESHLLGGDCLNMGCVPSKALLKCAKTAATVRRAGDYGVRVNGLDADALAAAVEVDFGAVMARMRRLRATIAHHDSAKRFADALGVDVYLGRGRFISENQVEVNGQRLTFAKAAIATGASPTAPPIPGLAEVPFLTNATLFNLTERPQRLAVIGGGVIGTEMAQAFARFGSAVTLFERGERIMAREDPDAALVVQQALADDGVVFEFGADIQRVSHVPPATGATFGTVTLHLPGREVTVDALLVATGRRANVDGLGLDEAGVEVDRRGGRRQ